MTVFSITNPHSCVVSWLIFLSTVASYFIWLYMNLANLLSQSNFKVRRQLKRRISSGAAVSLESTQRFFSDSMRVKECISTVIMTYVLLGRYFSKTVCVAFVSTRSNIVCQDSVLFEWYCWELSKILTITRFLHWHGSFTLFEWFLILTKWKCFLIEMLIWSACISLYEYSVSIIFYIALIITAFIACSILLFAAIFLWNKISTVMPLCHQPQI